MYEYSRYKYLFIFGILAGKQYSYEYEYTNSNSEVEWAAGGRDVIHIIPSFFCDVQKRFCPVYYKVRTIASICLQLEHCRSPECVRVHYIMYTEPFWWNGRVRAFRALL